MSDSSTMANTGRAAQAGGGLLGAYGQLEEGYAEQVAQELNASTARSNAVSALQQAAIDERRMRVHGSKVIGDMRASYGASGVTAEGSVMDVLKESAAKVAFDALNIKHLGDAKAVAYRNEASMDERRGSYAARAGEIGAVSTLFKSVGSAAAGGA